MIAAIAKRIAEKAARLERVIVREVKPALAPAARANVTRQSSMLQLRLRHPTR